MLSELEPRSNPRVYDLVTQAGLDTSDWANFKGDNPATNPKYCYEWSFVDTKKLVVLCLWYPQMDEKSGVISQTLNFRKRALEISREPDGGPRAKRAQRMDQAFQVAAKNKLPIRVIVGDGTRRGIDGATDSEVKRRMLDPVPWSVAAYDSNTGECRLVRGPPTVEFADQFSLLVQSSPERREVSGEVFIRSAEVRSKVLERANGICECCGQRGFLTMDGRLFLETHHIVPLSEGGADTVENVIALCPNEHREAHHGAKAQALRQEFNLVVSSLNLLR